MTRFVFYLKFHGRLWQKILPLHCFKVQKTSFSLSDRLRKLSEQVAAFWYRPCLISAYSGHSVRTCNSSSTLFAQLKHNLCSWSSLSYRPASIRFGTTPHLNLANALRCCLFNIYCLTKETLQPKSKLFY